AACGNGGGGRWHRGDGPAPGARAHHRPWYGCDPPCRRGLRGSHPVCARARAEAADGSGVSELAVWNARQLVTLAGPPRARRGAEMRELGIISNGAMLVRDGVIQATGPRAEIERMVSRDTEVVDAGDRIVLPGFVDAHTHPVFAGTRADEFEERIGGATYAEI